jgi:Concanavalin A-like lectin/glucanases superfamily
VVVSGLVMSGVSGLMPVGGASAAPAGPVLLYSFNNDVAGVTVKDSSTTKANGTLVNTTTTAASTTGAPGRGKAINLVGTQHQYIAVPERNALDVNTFTLAALVRYTGVVNDQTLDRWEVLEKAGAYWMNVRTDGHVRVGGFFGSCGASSSWKYFDSTVTVPVNVWTHIAGTYNGSTLTIWINGHTAGSHAVTGKTCANNEPLAVGAKNAPAKGLLEAFWDGQLDDVRVYNRALTAAQIAALVPV